MVKIGMKNCSRQFHFKHTKIGVLLIMIIQNLIYSISNKSLKFLILF